MTSGRKKGGRSWPLGGEGHRLVGLRRQSTHKARLPKARGAPNPSEGPRIAGHQPHKADANATRFRRPRAEPRRNTRFPWHRNGGPRHRRATHLESGQTHPNAKQIRPGASGEKCRVSKSFKRKRAVSKSIKQFHFAKKSGCLERIDARTGFQKVSKSINKYQTVSNSFIQFQTVSNSFIKSHSRLPGEGQGTPS